jgi:hypothetical protein
VSTLKLVEESYGLVLYVDGQPHNPEDDETFDVRAVELHPIALRSIPLGAKIRLCDKVIGSRDLFARTPNCTFERTSDNRLLGHVETPFFPGKEDLRKAEVETILGATLRHAAHELQVMQQAGIVLSSECRIYDEIAYMHFTLCLANQTFEEAEAYVGGLEARLYNGTENTAQPLLFVCHASEDKAFVTRLVRELDRRAQYAWFDKREILVGDSIVEQVNKALAEARFVIAVLSPFSVRKAWVMRELNSSLMRQLADQGIRVLPVVIATCDIPPLLADMKYADFRKSFRHGFHELLSAIRGTAGPSASV